MTKAPHPVLSGLAVSAFLVALMLSALPGRQNGPGLKFPAVSVASSPDDGAVTRL